MYSLRNTIYPVISCLLALSMVGYAQSERLVTWEQDLRYLASAPTSDPAAVRAMLGNIRNEVETWLKLHPASKIKLPAVSAENEGPEQLRTQIAQLQEVVTAITKEDPSHPFHLGVAEVNVTASVSELSPIADSIDQTEIAKRNELNVAAATEDLPGVSLSHQYSGRNQVMVQVHGFGYLQVPLYVDGIPMTDPYDGTLDFRQIPTGDIAEVQVAKGFSSPLMGPNAVGGAINVVTKQPEGKFEGDLLMGGASGNGFVNSVRLGSRQQKFFAQASMDWTQSDYVPLSGNFVPTSTQPNDQLNHSDQLNERYTARLGWTPRHQDQYVFTWINQKANGGIPINPGNDPLPGNSCFGLTAAANCAMGKTAYRDWSYWDKTSYYFHSSTGLGDKSVLKMRVFYDQYPNLMLFYNGLPYTTANLISGFNTIYDDHSDGLSSEFTTHLIPRNTLSASFFFKDDTHKEIPYPTPGSGQFLSDRQQTASIGIQDVVSITSHLLGTVGFSADHLDGLRAADSNNKNLAFIAPVCPSNTDLTNYSACTPHVWAYNPQVSLSYGFDDGGKLFAGFAEKSRFPVLKDMYSYKLNQGLPNPLLKPEESHNLVFGYSRPLAYRTVAQIEYFHSQLHSAIEAVNVPDPGIAGGGSADCPNSALKGNCSINENASKEVHQGVEFTVRTTPIQRLTFDASYTYLNKQISGFTFQGLPVTNYPCGGGYLADATTGTQTTQLNNTCLTPTDFPKHKAVLAGTLRLPRQSTLMATLRYESGTKQIDSYSATDTVTGVKNTSFYAAMPMSNFATVDLAGSTEIYRGTSLQAGVRNLFDRNYFYVLQIPEEGRNWFVNMRYRF